MTANLVVRMRALRDRLIGIPDRLGLPDYLDNVEIVASDGTHYPVSITVVGDVSATRFEALKLPGVASCRELKVLSVPGHLYPAISDGVCRVYIGTTEWVPVFTTEKPLHSEIIIRAYFDGEGWP